MLYDATRLMFCHFSPSLLVVALFKYFFCSPKVVKILTDGSAHQNVHLRSCFLEPFVSLVEDLANFCEMVETTVDLEVPPVDHSITCDEPFCHT
jgi:hypothetical protein